MSRNLRVESVSRLNPPTPLTIEAQASILDAVQGLRVARSGCVLVTEDGRLVGIFTERDLLKRVLAAGRSLGEPIRFVMTPDPVVVGFKDPIRLAVRRMEHGGYRQLPVVDEQNRPVGILTARHILHYVVEHFPQIVFNQPPAGQNFPATPEGA